MRFVRHRIVAGLLAAAALGFAAGCSTDSDDPQATGTSTSPAAPSTPTAAEYRQAANAVCVETEQGISELDNPPNATAEQTADILEDGLEIQQEGIDKLKALEPPANLQARHERAVRLVEQRQALTQQLLERIRDGEDIQKLTRELGPRIQRLRTQGDNAARALGLTECLDGPSGGGGGGTQTTGGGGGGANQSALNRYRADVRAAGQAIGRFATLLQSDESFDAKAERLQTNLDAFDKNIRELADYRLSNAQLERQRAGLARTGPEVTDVLRRFMEAAERGDESAIRDLAPEVEEVLSEFQSVVTQGGD